jgi:hypothetical protein
MKMIKKPRISRGPFLFLYLPIPEPGPVGVSVDPLGEALGPSVLPEGLWVLLGPAGAVVVEPAVLPVVPVVDEPVVVPVPVAELPPAEPVPLCASAKVAESANAAANAIVVSFMIDSLVSITKDNPPATSCVPRISARCKPLAQACHAAELVPHRVLLASEDTPDIAGSLEPVVLHSLKWEAIAACARWSHRSASPKCFQLFSGSNTAR